MHFQAPLLFLLVFFSMGPLIDPVPYVLDCAFRQGFSSPRHLLSHGLPSFQFNNQIALIRITGRHPLFIGLIEGIGSRQLGICFSPGEVQAGSGGAVVTSAQSTVPAEDGLDVLLKIRILSYFHGPILPASRDQKQKNREKCGPGASETEPYSAFPLSLFHGDIPDVFLFTEKNFVLLTIHFPTAFHKDSQAKARTNPV